MEQIFSCRRANLRHLIDVRYEGNRSQFARETGLNVNLVNLCLTRNVQLRRNIGEKLARKAEERTNLRPLSLDLPELEFQRLLAGLMADHATSKDAVLTYIVQHARSLDEARMLARRVIGRMGGS